MKNLWRPLRNTWIISFYDRLIEKVGRCYRAEDICDKLFDSIYMKIGNNVRFVLEKNEPRGTEVS